MKPGAGGNVFLVQHTKTHEKFVLKVSFVEEDKKKQFEEQMNFWKTLCAESEYFVLLKEYFFDGRNSCIIMEFCEKGDLETLIKKKQKEKGKFEEKDIVKILLNIMLGLKVMHKLKIIHRDIKPANILIHGNGKFKIADFNVSRILSEYDQRASTLQGTILYSAPEVLDNQSYSFSVDIYSIGAVIYELMTLTNAFTSISRVLANQYVPVNPELGYSEELVSFIRTLMSKNPSSRPTAAVALQQPLLAYAVIRCGMEAALEKQRDESVEREVEILKAVAEQKATIALLEERIRALELQLQKHQPEKKSDDVDVGLALDINNLLSTIGNLAQDLGDGDAS